MIFTQLKSQKDMNRGKEEDFTSSWWIGEWCDQIQRQCCERVLHTLSSKRDELSSSVVQTQWLLYKSPGSSPWCCCCCWLRSQTLTPLKCLNVGIRYTTKNGLKVLFIPKALAFLLFGWQNLIPFTLFYL